MKFDQSNKFDFCYYGEVNSLRLKSSVASEWASKHLKGPSTLATLFNHMWPRIVADPSTLGRHVCYVCKRSVCGGDEPQPVAHLSHKLQCARQSLKIMVSYGNKYLRHNARPHVVEQSGQCARALRSNIYFAGDGT